MSSREFAEWIAFYKLQAEDEQKEDELDNVDDGLRPASSETVMDFLDAGMGTPAKKE